MDCLIVVSQLIFLLQKSHSAQRNFIRSIRTDVDDHFIPRFDVFQIHKY